MQPVEVGLYTTSTSDELFDEFMQLSVLQQQADQFVADLRRVRQEAQSVQEKVAMDETLEKAWQEYQVLCAYVQVVYSAYVFRVYGTESVYLDQFGFQAGDRDKFTQ